MKAIVIQLEHDSGLDGVPDSYENQEIWLVDDSLDLDELESDWFKVHRKLETAWINSFRTTEEMERLKEYKEYTFMRYLEVEAGATLITFKEHVL